MISFFSPHLFPSLFLILICPRLHLNLVLFFFLDDLFLHFHPLSDLFFSPFLSFSTLSFCLFFPCLSVFVLFLSFLQSPFSLITFFRLLSRITFSLSDLPTHLDLSFLFPPFLSLFFSAALLEASHCPCFFFFLLFFLLHISNGSHTTTPSESRRRIPSRRRRNPI